jgi:hypothetical protein
VGVVWVHFKWFFEFELETNIFLVLLGRDNLHSLWRTYKNLPYRFFSFLLVLKYMSKREGVICIYIQYSQRSVLYMVSVGDLSRVFWKARTEYENRFVEKKMMFRIFISVETEIVNVMNFVRRYWKMTEFYYHKKRRWLFDVFIPLRKLNFSFTTKSKS